MLNVEREFCSYLYQYNEFFCTSDPFCSMDLESDELSKFFDLINYVILTPSISFDCLAKRTN
jgi:hypothetical protein